MRGLYLVASFPFAQHFNFALKGGIATPITTVQPAPHGVIGFGCRISDAFGLAVSGGYKYLPHYDTAKSSMHVATAALVPSFPISDKITIFVPLGPAYNATTHAWSFAPVFELGFLLGKR